jgi:hypothetical protein
MIAQRSRLLRELTTYFAEQDTTNFGMLDFVSAFGSPVEAMMYAGLFWPDIVEVDEMTFRADVIEDDSDMQRVRDALDRTGNRDWVEKSFNSLEIPSGVFGRGATESSSDMNKELAVLLGEIWRARLGAAFPDRRYHVEVMTNGADEPTVTFFTVRT